MFRVWLLGSLSTLCTVGLLSSDAWLPRVAIAQQVPLTRATVQAVRNQVRLIAQNRSPRTAQVSDTMVPGDALATAISSLAELRFNDGSLARVGEQAVFRFVPKTRTFQLSNGTLLMLIPPGRGQTNIRTPNATAGIKGSSFFIRTFPASNSQAIPSGDNDFAGVDTGSYVTVMGVLGTDPSRPMEISLANRAEPIVLRAGQMAIVSGNRIDVVRYDVNEFLNSAEIVQGLNLNQSPAPTEPDQAMVQIRQEIVATLGDVKPLDANQTVYENPAGLKLPNNRPANPGSSLARLENPARGNPVTPLNIINPSRSGRAGLVLEQVFTANDVLLGPTISVSSFPGGNFPGGGATGGNFPGGGATGGNFPGGGATGGNFPGGGATGGVFPGRGATGGVFPGRGRGVSGI